MSIKAPVRIMMSLSQAKNSNPGAGFAASSSHPIAVHAPVDCIATVPLQEQIVRVVDNIKVLLNRFVSIIDCVDQCIPGGIISVDDSSWIERIVVFGFATEVF